MQKVITINLNGHAYQLEEGGYDVLRDYLARAERDLAGNPDRAEIVADLEQAIADKCQRFLGPHKSVVTAGEVQQIVAEMGPVDPAPGDGSAGSAGAGPTLGSEAPPKRLYRITEGAMLAGVCNGLAAYFSIDVAIVRIGFVVTAFLTQGVGIIAYVVLMFVMPEASTAEERAAAAGSPLNAQEVVDRAKKQYAEGTRRLRRHWRQHQRQWRRHAGAPGVFVYGPPRMAPVLMPVFGLLQFALFFVLVAAMVSLVNTGEVLGWELPPDMPVWAGLLILLVGYQLISSPLRGMQYMSAQPGAGLHPAGYGFWNAVVSLVALAFLFWFAAGHIPEIQEFLQRLPEVGREFADAMRELFAR
ncbi:MAG TPA: PspC domain-containing protein [Vicinamibacterales bacterium]|nr:PspC domain-containing protein [Vicinamibacterales bacterium]